MSVSLKKGGRISLTKEAPGISKYIVGLGWDPVESKGFLGLFHKEAAIDCDASAIMLRNGKYRNKRDLIYFGSDSKPNDPIYHTGDNVTGEGKGDDERIIVDLEKLPSDVNEIVFTVNIYKGKKNHQTFDKIKNAFIRVMDKDEHEFVRYDLSCDDSFKGKYSVIVGKLYLHNGEWRFSAIGQESDLDNIHEIAARFS